MWLFNRLLRDEAGADGADGGGGGEGDAGAVGSDGDTGDNAGANGGVGGDAGTVEGYFNAVPEDWRTQAVKAMGVEEGSDDFDKRIKQLERVSDASVLFKNYFSAQDRIRAGEISNGLPENPSEGQVAEWREANGVPATPEDYQLSLDEGLVLGESDERILESVYKVAHENNIPASAISALTNSMLAGRQAEAEAIVSQDGVDHQTTERQLKETWGGDFQTNLNMVTGLVNQLPETIRDAFTNARMADGRAVFNSPEVMVAMAEWARIINPAATVVGSANNPMQTIDDEIKTLEGRMGTPEWFKDQAAQKRYVDLIDARDTMKKRTA